MMLHRGDFFYVKAEVTPTGGVVVNEYFEDAVVGYYKFTNFLAYLLLRRDIDFDGIPDDYIRSLLFLYRRGDVPREGVITLLQNYTEEGMG